MNRSVSNLVWVPIGHPAEVRRDAVSRVAAGQDRHLVAEELDIPYRTVCEWAKHLPRSVALHDLRTFPLQPSNELAPYPLPGAEAG